MANYTNEQLYNALKLIQDICKSQGKCSYCPLRLSNTDFCAIQEIAPHQYDLIQPDEYKPFR